VRRVIAALLFVLVIPPVVTAHEGHDHRFMGTVSVIHENHLEVRTADGRTTTIALEAKTRILRGKAKVTASDIKTGERTVVTATQKKDKDGKPIMVAKEVRLAEAASGKSS